MREREYTSINPQEIGLKEMWLKAKDPDFYSTIAVDPSPFADHESLSESSWHFVRSLHESLLDLLTNYASLSQFERSMVGRQDVKIGGADHIFGLRSPEENLHACIVVTERRDLFSQDESKRGVLKAYGINFVTTKQLEPGLFVQDSFKYYTVPSFMAIEGDPQDTTRLNQAGLLTNGETFPNNYHTRTHLLSLMEIDKGQKRTVSQDDQYESLMAEAALRVNPFFQDIQLLSRSIETGEEPDFNQFNPEGMGMVFRSDPTGREVLDSQGFMKLANNLQDFQARFMRLMRGCFSVKPPYLLDLRDIAKRCYLSPITAISEPRELVL